MYFFPFTEIPPLSLIFLMASWMPSLWYCPGLPSRPVMGSTTPIVIASPPCAAANGVPSKLMSSADNTKPDTAESRTGFDALPDSFMATLLAIRSTSPAHFTPEHREFCTFRASLSSPELLRDCGTPPLDCRTSLISAECGVSSTIWKAARRNGAPGGLELPTFWFPPQADSIELSYERYEGCAGPLPGPGRTSGTFPAASPPRAW